MEPGDILWWWMSGWAKCVNEKIKLEERVIQGISNSLFVNSAISSVSKHFSPLIKRYFLKRSSDCSLAEKPTFFVDNRFSKKWYISGRHHSLCPMRIPSLTQSIFEHSSLCSLNLSITLTCAAVWSNRKNDFPTHRDFAEFFRMLRVYSWVIIIESH